MNPSLPNCLCGNNTNFVLREFRRTTGSFSISGDRLIFREHQGTADLEQDAVLCGNCLQEIATEDFDVET